MKWIKNLALASLVTFFSGCSTFKGTNSLEREVVKPSPGFEQVDTGDNRISSDPFGIIPPLPEPNFGDTFPDDSREIPGVALILKYPVENPSIYLIHIRQIHMVSEHSVLFKAQDLREMKDELERKSSDENGKISEEDKAEICYEIEKERDKIDSLFRSHISSTLYCQSLIYDIAEYLNLEYDVDKIHLEGLTDKGCEREGWTSSKTYKESIEGSLETLKKLGRLVCRDYNLSEHDLGILSGGAQTYCHENGIEVYPGESEAEYNASVDEAFRTRLTNFGPIEDREDGMIRVIAESGNKKVIFPLGADHFLGDNARTHNFENPGKRIYLIDIIPGDIPLYIDWETNEIKPYEVDINTSQTN
jgi:hypothetical protein|tara:strand:+ start:1571 stop:2653 length:1083 start_codon:yes stop_codon:yes gene_type:complete